MTEKGDLISREALKEAYFNAIEKSSIGEVSILDVIDNAPTVEQKYYERVIAQINPVIEARPQGEWGKWIIAEVQCPNCFKYFEVDYYSAEELNKCPNCGAEMQKGGAE